MLQERAQRDLEVVFVHNQPSQAVSMPGPFADAEQADVEYITINASNVEAVGKRVLQVIDEFIIYHAYRERTTHRLTRRDAAHATHRLYRAG